MLVVRDGDVTVTLSDELEVLARRALDVAAPVLAEMERQLNEELAAAKADWPVRSGVSRDGLHIETQVVLDKGVRVSIRGGPAYTAWVRPRQLHGASTTAWAGYVTPRVRAAHGALAERLGEVILAAMVKRG